MPGWWVFAIILYFIAAAALVVSVLFVSNADGGKVIGIGIAVIIAVVGVVCTVVSAYDRVDTRNVGIITDFGRPDGVHGAGIAWHAPWKKMSELSEAIQLQAFESNGYDDAAKGQGANGNPAAIQVRLANNSSAYVDENLNWRLREGAAPKLFQDYGGGKTDVFEQIKNNLVDRQAQTILSHEFASFNPQATPQGFDPNNPASTTVMTVPDLPSIAAKVKRDLQLAVGDEIEILDVRIPRIFYDSATQNRIDDFNKKVQETRNAQQDVATALQRKAANDAIAASVQNPLTIVAQCMDSRVRANLDPGTCWGPMGGIGGSDRQPLITVPRS